MWTVCMKSLANPVGGPRARMVLQSCSSLQWRGWAFLPLQRPVIVCRPSLKESWLWARRFLQQRWSQQGLTAVSTSSWGSKSFSPGGDMGGYHGAQQPLLWICYSFSKTNCSWQRSFFSIGYLLRFPVEESMFKAVCSHATHHKPEVFLLTQFNQLLAPCLVWCWLDQKFYMRITFMLFLDITCLSSLIQSLEFYSASLCNHDWEGSQKSPCKR